MPESNEELELTFSDRDAKVLTISGTKVVIHPQFHQEIDNQKFLLLDFYRSRGVYSITTCRLNKHKDSRHWAKVLRLASDELRKYRDAEFRKVVVAGAKDNTTKFIRGVVPKQKRLRVIALAMNEVITVHELA